MKLNPNWPKQSVFIDRVMEFARRERMLTPRGAKDLEALAVAFDLDRDTIKQFMENKKRPEPHFKTLLRIAQRIGVDVDEFVGDVGGPASVKGTLWDMADPETRQFAELMLHLGARMSSWQRQTLIEQAHSLLKNTPALREIPELPGRTTGEKCRLAREKYDMSIPQVVAQIKKLPHAYPFSERILKDIEADREPLDPGLASDLSDLYNVEFYKLLPPSTVTAKPIKGQAPEKKGSRA